MRGLRTGARPASDKQPVSTSAKSLLPRVRRTGQVASPPIGPGINILATSREPLGVAGESGYRLEPLSTPPLSSRLTAAEAEVSPAVQLFVERVAAIVEDFALTDANAPLVAEICRKLDGLPLAIEFAAPRVEALGVEGLAANLDDSLAQLGVGRRTAMPRHQTMRAVVDWSYGLLSEDEQLFFRALGIDPGFEVPIYRYRPWTDSTLGTIRPRDERRCGYRLLKIGTIDGDVIVPREAGLVCTRWACRLPAAEAALLSASEIPQKGAA
jgi:hypothetical protein